MSKKNKNEKRTSVMVKIILWMVVIAMVVPIIASLISIF